MKHVVSARSFQGFDVYKALSRCSSLLSAFGGHKSAAGLTVSMRNIDSFIEKFNDIAQQELLGQDMSPAISVDAEISLEQLSYEVMGEIEALSPFGPSNPEPVFTSSEIKFFSSMVVGKNHLKLRIKEKRTFFLMPSVLIWLPNIACRWKQFAWLLSRSSIFLMEEKIFSLTSKILRRDKLNFKIHELWSINNE